MKGFQCDELFAFVAEDEDGNEGVVSAVFENNTIPLVCPGLEVVKTFVPIAAQIAKSNGINIKLYHYRRLGEVSKDFIDQFVGVRLEGDPGGSGKATVEREESSNGSSNGGEPK